MDKKRVLVTVAGTGLAGSTGDGGKATGAQINGFGAEPHPSRVLMQVEGMGRTEIAGLETAVGERELPRELQPRQGGRRPVEGVRRV